MWNPAHLWVTMLGVGFLKRLLLCLFCHVDVVLLSFVVEQMSSWGFPDRSAGKESACNAGDTSLISGSGRSLMKGIGYPLQYSWASLVAQMVKNLPQMQETLVWPCVEKIPWRRACNQLQYSCLEYPHWQRSLVGYSPWGSQRVGHNWVTKHSTAAQIFS